MMLMNPMHSKELTNGMTLHLSEQKRPHRFWVTIVSEGETKACRSFLKVKNAHKVFDASDDLTPYKLVKKVMGI